jgi:hypothetical protein
MKNLFFSFTLILSVSFVFGSSNNNGLEQIDATHFMVEECYYYAMANNTFEVCAMEIESIEQNKSCTVKGKVTITNSDGSSTTVEGTITIEGKSCSELLKELMKS